MARTREYYTKITDDLTGEALTPEEATDVKLSYESNYDLDLSRDNAKKLDDFLKSYLNTAEPTNRTKSRFPKSGIEREVKRDNQNIRAWAAENGFEVAPRGIIKQEVRDAYDKAH